MKYYLPFLLGLCTLAAAFPEKPSLTINQAAYYPAGYGLAISANSSSLNGFILIKSPDQLPSLSPEIYTFGIKITPLPVISILAGSITSSGLPARARNPVFSLTAPFYTPVRIQSGQILTNSSTKSTGNLACEISAKNWKLAAFSGALQNRDDPSWILVSRVLPAFSIEKTAASFAFFGGSYQTKNAENTSWFLPEMDTPDTRIVFPGAEIIIQKDKLSASCTALLDIAQLKKPSGAIRADTNITWKQVSIAGGIYHADRNFANMQGVRNSIISRAFLAPSLEIPVSINFNFRWGGILFADTIRSEHFYEADGNTITAGTGFDLTIKKVQLQMKLMKPENDYTVSGSMTISEFIHKSLKVEFSGEKKTAGTTISSGITFKPVPWFCSGFEISRVSPESSKIPDYSGDLSAAFNFKTRRLAWNLATKISVINIDSPFTGSLSLKTVIQ